MILITHRGVVRDFVLGKYRIRYGTGLTDIEWIVSSEKLEMGDKGTLNYIKSGKNARWVFVKDK